MNTNTLIESFPVKMDIFYGQKIESRVRKTIIPINIHTFLSLWMMMGEYTRIVLPTLLMGISYVSKRTNNWQVDIYKEIKKWHYTSSDTSGYINIYVKNWRNDITCLLTQVDVYINKETKKWHYTSLDILSPVHITNKLDEWWKFNTS